jgi:hypothetical protein
MMAGFNIDALRNQSHDISMPPTPQVVPQHGPITYITQHYTHSAHVPQQYSETSVSDALAAAGVDASGLLPSQIQLFRHAQPDQQARLLELWRIAPPTSGNQLLAKHLGSWPSTSLAIEEEAAEARWQHAEQQKVKNLCAPQVLAEPYILDGYQNLEFANEVDHIQHSESNQDKHATECGVEREREWWQMEDQPMELQYGLLQQMRMQGLQLDSQDEEML